MALLSRLKQNPRKAAEGDDAAPTGEIRGSSNQELKFRVHNRLFELLDLAKLSKVSEERIREDIAVATRRVLEEEKALLTLEERDRIVREMNIAGPFRDAGLADDTVLPGCQGTLAARGRAAAAARQE